ncbi:MAG TPA: amidohydrolase family protein [Candidatus Acidoferrum sp.]|jgi:L-fuconolactonase|nr:amidohydrolase family protein [Candidatus Acidoferrum sp.]
MTANAFLKMADEGNLAITDAQVHVWERVAIPGREHRKPPLGAHELMLEMAKAGVKRAILIPPSWAGDGNTLVVEAAKVQPTLFAVIGRLAFEDPAFRATLERWSPENGMLGVRLLFNTPEYVELLRGGSIDWIWPAAEKHQIPVMILAHDSNEVLKRIAAEHPRLRLVIDHLGMTRGVSGPEFREGIERLLMLASVPNIAVKATALPLYSEGDYPHLDVLAQIRRVIDAFSADRVFWGTDLTRLRCSYRESVEMMSHLDWKDEHEIEQVMGNSILSWLGWRV